MRIATLTRLLCRAILALVPLCTLAQAAPQTSPGALPTATPALASKESLWQLMHDPNDHAIDMSRWLLQHKGALIVPIVITEPADRKSVV